MPNVTRGERMTGLLVYLAGPGRHNEHTDPHLVVGDASVMAVYVGDAGQRLDVAAARQVAHTLDQPRRVLGVDVPGGSVWHCSLSLRADEGQLSDEKWAAIATDFVQRMGFAETSGWAPCRWAAVRHGLSANGNDHIHLVVSLVREDGTKADVWNDFPRAQRVCGDLEREHGLEVLASRTVGRGERGLHPAEVAAAHRTGAPEPARVSLARLVRAAATSSVDEADFVRSMRGHGLLVRPRYADGSVNVVTGFSVAQRPTAGERPVWFGGGRLARDLTLPRLRTSWSSTAVSTRRAAAEWSTRGRAVNSPVSTSAVADVGPDVWRDFVRQIEATRRRLRDVPADDHATWAGVAHDSAGVFATWSAHLEPTPGPLAATADALARSAQLRAAGARDIGVRVPRQAVRGAALLVAGLAGHDHEQVAMAALLRQYANLAKAVHDAHAAAGDARRARQIEIAVRQELIVVAHQLPSEPMPTAQPPGRGKATVAAGPPLTYRGTATGYAPGGPARERAAVTRSTSAAAER